MTKKNKYHLIILEELQEQWVDVESRPLSEEQYQRLVEFFGAAYHHECDNQNDIAAAVEPYLPTA